MSLETLNASFKNKFIIKTIILLPRRMSKYNGLHICSYNKTSKKKKAQIWSNKLSSFIEADSERIVGIINSRSNIRKRFIHNSLSLSLLYLPPPRRLSSIISSKPGLLQFLWNVDSCEILVYFPFSLKHLFLPNLKDPRITIFFCPFKWQQSKRNVDWTEPFLPNDL